MPGSWPGIHISEQSGTRHLGGKANRLKAGNALTHASIPATLSIVDEATDERRRL